MRGSSWSALNRFGPYAVAALVWRADFRCTWCEVLVTRTTYCIDHLIPRAQGGGHEHGNLVLSCRTCNLERGPFGGVPDRATRRGKSLARILANIFRQIAIPVGRGTEANRRANRVAHRWFKAQIERANRANKRYRREQEQRENARRYREIMGR